MDKLELTRFLFFILVPVVFFSGVAAILTSLLHAYRKFGFASLVLSMLPLLLILLFIFFGAREGIALVAFGTLAGVVLECLILWVVVSKRRISLGGARHPATGLVLRQLVPVMAGAMLMPSTPARGSGYGRFAAWFFRREDWQGIRTTGTTPC